MIWKLWRESGAWNISRLHGLVYSRPSLSIYFLLTKPSAELSAIMMEHDDNMMETLGIQSHFRAPPTLVGMVLVEICISSELSIFNGRGKKRRDPIYPVNSS